jgi:hypothetical protein
VNLPGAAALAVMTVMSGLTIITRYWPERSYGLHRKPRVPLTLDTLIGEPSAYTSYTTLADAPSPGPIRQGFGECKPCDEVTAGVITKDGFTCGQCLTPAGGER